MHNSDHLVTKRLNPDTVDNGFLEIIDTMSKITDISNLFEFVLDQAIFILDAENGCIVKLKQDGTFGFPAVRHHWGGYYNPEEDPISTTVLTTIIMNRVPILTSDAMADPRFSASQSIVARSLRSILSAPLIVDNKLIGAIYLENRSKKGRFSMNDLDTLDNFSRHAARALNNLAPQ